MAEERKPVKEIKVLQDMLKKQGYRPKGPLDFTVHVEYKGETLKVWITPPNADMNMVQGVLAIAYTELTGIPLERITKEPEYIW